MYHYNPFSLENDMTWIKLNLSTSIKSFTKKIGVNQSFHRKLFYSTKKIGGQTNRSFFKNYFTSIYYTTNLINEETIELTFYFLPLKTKDIKKIFTQLLTRIKSIYYGEVVAEFLLQEKLFPLIYPQFFQKKLNLNNKNYDFQNRH